MKNIRSKPILGALAAASLLVGCPDPETLKIGVIISTTGGYGALGGERTQGAQLAVEEINKAGGVLGQQLELLAQDDATTRANAKSIAEGMIADGIQVIIGPSFSGGSLEVLTVTGPAKVLQLSGSATSPALSTAVDNGIFFRTCAPDTAQAAVLAKKANDATLRKVVLIVDEGDGKAYSEGIANEFETKFEALHASNLVIARVVLPSGRSTYKPELDTLFAAHADAQAVLLPVYAAQGAVVIADYKKNQSSYPNVTWLLADSTAEADFVTAVGTNGGSFSGVTHFGTGPGASAELYSGFADRYKTQYGSFPEETSFAANYYDATYLLALAIEAAGELNGEKLAQHYGAVSEGGEKYTFATFKEAVAAIKAGGNVDYDGVSGPVDLNSVGEPSVAPYNIWSVQNNQISVTERGVLP